MRSCTGRGPAPLGLPSAPALRFAKSASTAATIAIQYCGHLSGFVLRRDGATKYNRTMGCKPIHRTTMTDAKLARRDARDAAMGRQLCDATPKADRYHSATRHCYVDLFKEYAGAAFL